MYPLLRLVMHRFKSIILDFRMLTSFIETDGLVWLGVKQLTIFTTLAWRKERLRKNKEKQNHGLQAEQADEAAQESKAQ